MAPAKTKDKAKAKDKAPDAPAADAAAATDEPADAADAAGHKKFYCPACGLQSDFQEKCAGKAEGGHAPLRMVSTEELSGDPANHTAVPNTGD